VPGGRPRFHAKAATVPADEIILDLEDSVPAAEKEAARAQVTDSILRWRYDEQIRAVRINSFEGRWGQDDLRWLVERAGARIDCIVMPKVEGPSEVVRAERLLDQLEQAAGLDHRISLEVQIETARGMAAVHAIAAAGWRLEALILGPIDLAADLGMPAVNEGVADDPTMDAIWVHHLSTVLVAARAHGLQAIDGPFPMLESEPGLERSARRSALVGFDGKWAINPIQLDTINRLFSPSQLEFERALAVIDAQARSEAAGAGASRFEGEMIDEATRRLALRLVERGRKAGMRAGGEEATPA